MDIISIKDLPDKAPIDSVRGIVEKQYPPTDQTDNDLKFGQHRQSILINDGNGEKLMITFMKSSLHILDNIEGNEIILSAGRNDANELRGLLVSRYRQSGKDYDSISVKVYPEATIRAIPAGGAAAPQQSQPQASSAKSEAPATGLTPFEKHLALAAYGYCLCLDKAAEVIADRPDLHTDSTNLRTIATNFWMDCKHHLQTLAPGLQGQKTVAKGKEAEAPVATSAAPPASRPPADPVEQSDELVIQRLIDGHTLRENEPDKINPAAQRALKKLEATCEDRGIWDKAYDKIVANFIEDDEIDPFKYSTADIKAAEDKVYNHLKDSAGTKKINIEKLIVTAPVTWKKSMIEILKETNP